MKKIVFIFLLLAISQFLSAQSQIGFQASRFNVKKHSSIDRFQEEKLFQVMPGISYNYTFKNRIQLFSAFRATNVGLIDTGLECYTGEADFHRLRFKNFQVGTFYKIGKYRLQPKVGLACNFESYKINSWLQNDRKIYTHSKADFLGLNSILALEYRIYKKFSVQLQAEVSTNQVLQLSDDFAKEIYGKKNLSLISGMALQYKF